MRTPALLLAACLALGGCATTTATVDPSTQVSAVIAQVQAITTQICAFVPTAASVAALISAQPGVGVAAQIAAAICSAATAKSARLKGAAPITVNGITIHGRFTNGVAI